MAFVGDSSPDESATKCSSDLEKAVSDLEASAAATSGNGKKIGGSKDTGHSVRNSINKFTSQIKKPPHRKTVSPLNWFPRKKGDSFLKRKIKHLQEIGGMNLSLDETLGNANPHYTRIAREKIAAQQAARKAMEARKVAMVEASWCRILGAARIRSQEAEVRLEKAEKYAEEAFEAARAMGVMMYDRPDSHRRPCEIETALAIGGQSTHKVTASFETAFEVDKEVAAAVKRALVRLANCPSSLNKEEFRGTIFKINQNPDTNNTIEGPIDLSSERETPGAELQQDSHSDDSGKQSATEFEDRKHKNSLLPAVNGSGCSMSPTDLTDTMLDRLKCLHEDELSSLAVIVATCGLSAALREMQTIKNNDLEPISGEIPSLDKFLVKHVSKLEKEVQETKKNNMALENQRMPGILENQVVEKKSSVKEGEKSKELKVEGEIQTMGANSIEPSSESFSLLKGKQHISEEELLEGLSRMSLSKVYERVIITQKQNEDTENPSITTTTTENFGSLASDDSRQQNKENLDVIIPAYGKNKPIKCMSRIEGAKVEVSKTYSVPYDIDDDTHKMMGLDNILVKPIHRSANEKMEAREDRRDLAVLRETKKHGTHATAPASLDTILVKHVSRLEKEKLALAANEGLKTVKKSNKQYEENAGSLGEVLVKRQSKLEKAKISATQQSADYIKHEAGREARQRELQEVWGGLSLENSIRPRLSRIEREKAAWKKAEEEERMREMELQKKIE